MNLTLLRRDGFDSAVDIVAEGLPPGITATPARIEGHELTGILALSADASAPAFSPPTWRIVAREARPASAAQSLFRKGERGASAPCLRGPSFTGQGADAPRSPGPDPSGTDSHEDPPHRQDIDPGGPKGGWITVTPASNLKVSARPNRVVIHPGERVSMTLAVQRAPAFSGRVPIEVKNLPQGVKVQDIGLNGVLVTEKQVERSIFLLAEPWVQPMVRPFYAVGNAESADTEDSSPPIELHITPLDTKN